MRPRRNTRPVPSPAIAAVALLFITPLGAQPTPADLALDDLLPRIAPVEPKDALSTFRLDAGLRIELAAAEPDVADPIALAFDEDGRMYVAEMRDYPYDPSPDNPPLGRVRRLEDRDGDGLFEHSTIFADHVHWPSGVAPWKGGVFVAAPPDVLYMKDTDGDGVADLRRAVFVGFGTRRAEDIMNNLEWGLDHRIYGGTSYNAGEVRPADAPDAEPINVRGRDFRFDPVTFALDPQAGTGDFGNAFDDWGNRFACSASHLVMHVVYPSEYFERNPYLTAPQMLEDITREEGRGRVHPIIQQPEPWRVVRQQYWKRWVDTTPDMRAARFPPAELAPQGYVTGAAGVKIYRGSALPPAYHGNAFTGEVAGNLVVRTILEPAGVTFHARRADRGREFLASTDNWFRPVNFANGPDGCLYVLDMYREAIEDPSAIPEEILEHLDMLSGNDRGRIYRITPDGFARPAPPRLSDADTARLVALLERPDAWWRETAHRLMYERQDHAAVPALKHLVESSTLPQARLHALWSLHGLDALDEPTLLKALDDAHPAVREHAVRLAEHRLESSSVLLDKVLERASDPNARVRFQTALTLSALNGPRITAALADIARRDLDDPHIRTAVLVGLATRAGEVFRTLLADEPFLDRAGAKSLLEDLAEIVGTRNDREEVAALITDVLGPDLAARPALQRAVLNDLARGLRRAGTSLRAALAATDGHRPDDRELLERLFKQSADAALHADPSVGLRMDAIEFLAYAPFDAAAKPLAELLDAREPADVQLAAVQSLSAHDDPAVATVLLDRWNVLSPPLRREATEALFTRPDRLPALLDAIEDQRIEPAHLDPVRRKALLEHEAAAIRDRAKRLFGEVNASSRQEVIARFRPALDLKGDAARGAELFQKLCATCHRAGGDGHNVGPDLATIRSRPAADLLEQIIDPNRQVQPNYVNYMVETDDGRFLTGIISSESSTSISLLRAEGAIDVVLRDAIDDLTSTGLSIMPEGLEQGLSPQDLADLLRFIQAIP